MSLLLVVRGGLSFAHQIMLILSFLGSKQLVSVDVDFLSLVLNPGILYLCLFGNSMVNLNSSRGRSKLTYLDSSYDSASVDPYLLGALYK